MKEERKKGHCSKGERSVLQAIKFMECNRWLCVNKGHLMWGNYSVCIKVLQGGEEKKVCEFLVMNTDVVASPWGPQKTTGDRFTKMQKQGLLCTQYKPTETSSNQLVQQWQEEVPRPSTGHYLKAKPEKLH